MGSQVGHSLVPKAGALVQPSLDLRKLLVSGQSCWGCCWTVRPGPRPWGSCLRGIPEAGHLNPQPLLLDGTCPGARQTLDAKAEEVPEGCPEQHSKAPVHELPQDKPSWELGPPSHPVPSKSSSGAGELAKLGLGAGNINSLSPDRPCSFWKGNLRDRQGQWGDPNRPGLGGPSGLAAKSGHASINLRSNR